MEIFKITKEEFNNLESFHLIEGILEKESDLYYAPYTHNEVVKVYKNYHNKRYIEEKIEAMHNLITYTNEISFPELLKPHKLLMVEDTIMGPIYPKIDGYTARIYLYTFYCPIKMKIEILRKIGALLEKIKNTNPKYNAAFSDVHVDNFMIQGLPDENIKNNPHFNIIACDTDSMKIMTSPGITGYYLYDSERFEDMDKYPLDDDGFVKASSNTDIYCYSMMILDLISRSEYVYSLNIDEYYRYLDYLDKIGFDSNILKCFASLYEDDKDNISPLPYINSLTKMSNNSTLLSFYKNRTLKK